MIRTPLALGGCLVLLAGACQQSPGAARRSAHVDGQPAAAAAKIAVIERTGRMEQYPCMKCHDKVVPRPLKLPITGRHRDLRLGHFDGIAECYLCHDRANTDRLRLLTGALITFNESYKLCGQCHGEKLRDWNTGAHGKLIGRWKGPKYRLGCTDCHDPHTPALGAVKALPPPPFPTFGIPKGGHQ